jgi:hypothetical protein
VDPAFNGLQVTIIAVMARHCRMERVVDMAMDTSIDMSIDTVVDTTMNTAMNTTTDITLHLLRLGTRVCWTL